jgi:hypothetical protein
MVIVMDHVIEDPRWGRGPTDPKLVLMASEDMNALHYFGFYLHDAIFPHTLIMS